MATPRCKWTKDKRNWWFASGGTVSCRITPYDRAFRLICNDSKFGTELEAFDWGEGVAYLKRKGCSYITTGNHVPANKKPRRRK